MSIDMGVEAERDRVLGLQQASPGPQFRREEQLTWESEIGTGSTVHYSGR